MVVTVRWSVVQSIKRDKIKTDKMVVKQSAAGISGIGFGVTQGVISSVMRLILVDMGHRLFSQVMVWQVICYIPPTVAMAGKGRLAFSGRCNCSFFARFCLAKSSVSLAVFSNSSIKSSAMFSSLCGQDNGHWLTVIQQFIGTVNLPPIHTFHILPI